MLFSIISTNPAFSQLKNEICPSVTILNQPEPIANPTAQQRGLLKPAITGANQFFRVLFVFVEFEGNTYSSPSWPLNSLPSWSGDLIDPVKDQYRPLTFSKFWDVMSMGQYDFIGEVYPNIVKVKSEEYYRTNGYNFSESNRDVFKKLDLDASVDWSRYDNWKYNSNTKAYEFQSDGVVDMVYVIYRNSSNDPGLNVGWFTSKTEWSDPNQFSDPNKNNIGNFAGIAQLGRGPFSTLFLTDNWKGINFTPSELGSGITIRSGINYSSGFDIIELLAHEFGHYLFGGGHENNSFSIMSNNPEQRNCQLSSLEREYLGYISFITPSLQDGQVFPLTDALTTGYVLKVIPYENPVTNYFLVIENHQRKSPFDQIDKGNVGNSPSSIRGKGIYAFYVQQDPEKINNSTVGMKNADGCYKWGRIGDAFIGDAKVPLLEKTGVNRNSTFGDRNFLDFKYSNFDENGFAPFHVKNRLTKEWQLTWACYGDEQDAFTLYKTKMMTPWSNPSTLTPGYPNPFAFEITNQNEQATSIKTYITETGALSLPPSKPQLFKVTIENGSPRLNWAANIEPDLKEYKIYKAITSGTEPSIWSLVATVNKTLSTYFDESVTASSVTQSQKIFYRIQAIDNSLLVSEFSDYDWLYYDWMAQKISGNDGEDKELVSSFEIEKAYPNPFNPGTTVAFLVPEQGLVSWQVVDLQGRIVIDGVKQMLDYGRNQVFIDGTGLASGIYLFRLSFQNQIKTQKLFLVK